MAFSNLGHFVQEHICTASRAGNTKGDIALCERGGQENSEVHEEIYPESPVEKVKKEFRRSLQKMFSDSDRVEEIMSDIERWEAGR